MKMSSKVDKEAAFCLYIEGFKQKDIAKSLKVTEATICTWVKEGDWEDKRTKKRLFRQNAESSIESLISFQLDVLERIKTVQEQELNSAQTVVELEKLLIKRGDIDALQKLFTTIKDERELDWKAKVRIITRFAEEVSKVDNELAKKLTVHVTEFITQERQQDFKDK